MRRAPITTQPSYIHPPQQPSSLRVVSHHHCRWLDSTRGSILPLHRALQSPHNFPELRFLTTVNFNIICCSKHDLYSHVSADWCIKFRHDSKSGEWVIDSMIGLLTQVVNMLIFKYLLEPHVPVDKIWCTCWLLTGNYCPSCVFGTSLCRCTMEGEKNQT